MMESEDSDLLFSEDEDEQEEAQEKPWRVLVVDDDPQVIMATKLALSDFSFDNRSIEFLSAGSGREAREILRREKELALVLLDVTMETEHEGLTVTKWIREELEDPYIRIILRTGQPGQAPEREVVVKYDINDYKEKTELSYRKMYTMMVAVLRSYRDLIRLRDYQFGLEHTIAERTRELSDEIEIRSQKQQELLAIEQELMVKNARLETALKNAQELNHTLGQFVSVTSHEIRTPLTVIDGLIQRLVRNAGNVSTEYALHKYEQMGRAIHRLEETLNRLLSGAVLEKGEWDFQPVGLPVRIKIEEIVTSLKEIDKGRKFLLDLEMLPETVCTDPEMFHHMLVNLLSNALKYSPDDTPVTIEGRQEDGMAVISVEDQGSGIAEEERQKIFKQFFRGRNANNIGGTGLGLHIARKLAERHKGTLDVENGTGRGSRFLLRLPIKMENPEASQGGQDPVD